MNSHQTLENLTEGCSGSCNQGRGACDCSRSPARVSAAAWKGIAEACAFVATLVVCAAICTLLGVAP